MDVDLVKSATEDQMEMMMMMMQMDNKQLQTEFSSNAVPHSEITDLSSIQFSGINGTGIDINMTMTMNMNMNMNTTTTTTLANFENPHLSSPTLISHPSSSSFLGYNGGSMQEPVLSNSMRQHVSDLSGAFTTYNPTSNSKRNSMAAMREMIFRIAAMQPIHIDPESVKPPKRRNVKISKDPQSVAARHRRERISERIRILQRLVPGGTKMDTASMLDEAIHYVKFLKTQVQSLEKVAVNSPMGLGLGAISNGNYSSLAKAYQLSAGGGQAFNSNSTDHQMLN